MTDQKKKTGSEPEQTAARAERAGREGRTVSGGHALLDGWRRFVNRLPEDGRLRKGLARLQTGLALGGRWVVVQSRAQLEKAGLVSVHRGQGPRRLSSSGVHPDDLMADIARSTLGRTFTISLIIHLVVIGLTSLPYFYSRLRPAEPPAAAEEAAAATEPAARAAVAAQETGSAADTASGAQKPAVAAEEKSPIEQELEAVSDERPDEPQVTFDEIDLLE